MRRRPRLPALVAAVGLILLSFSGIAAAAVHSPGSAAREIQAGLTAAQVRQLSAHATDRSIIIFKDQLTGLPVRGATAQPRVSAADAAQAPVRAELSALHATHVQGFHIINAIAATISPAEARRLRANPAVRAVVPDTLQHLAPQQASAPGPVVRGPAQGKPAPGKTAQGKTAPGKQTPGGRAAAVRHAAQQICPANPAKPLIEPEARSLMNVDAAQQIVDGTGLKVAVLADGFDPSNPDLIRPNGQHVVFDYQDFSGQGPDGPSVAFASFLGAGLVAAQGNQVYDLSKFVNPAHPLPAGCNIKIEGIAPGASLAELNWGGDDSAVFNSQILQTVQRAVMVDHVNVIDEPFGGSQVPNTEDDPVALADQAAVAAGVVVVAPTGDNGISSNDITSPGGVPGVIGVGATTAFQAYRQTDQNGPNLAPGGWEDNNISALSTGSINEFDPRTFDVVAPGDSIWALCSTDTARFFGCVDPFNGSSPGISDVQSTGASSSAVAGVATLVMQAYAKTHHGTLPPAPLVERIIVSTATDLGAPADHQGAGLVNALKAVQLAESIHSSSPKGRTLLVSRTGLNATVHAGQSHTFSIGVTNSGGAPQTVTPSVSGRPVTLSADTGSVTLSSSSPTQTDGFGATDSYQAHTFMVRPGADYLNGDMVWNAQQAGGSVFEELFDPQGNLAAYSVMGVLQSGFGHVEVRNPMPGRWTAVIYTPSNAQYFGPVQFSNTTENFRTAGSVWPASRTLAPGQSATFHVTVTAHQAGDEAFRLHLGTGSGTDGSIPIVLRALVPTTQRGGTFAGTLTGDGSPGFGSTAGGGQMVTYQFQVPAGEPSLNVAINLADSDYVVKGSLITASGEPLDLQSTVNNANGPGPSLQFFRRTPAAGLWTVSLITTGPVDGAHLIEPFTGKISFTRPAVTSSGLPDSAATVLPAGQPASAQVTVTNNGNIAKDYFADPRLDTKAPMTLLGTAVRGSNNYNQTQLTVPEPMTAPVNPHWLVPTDTSLLVATAHGTVPIYFDINSDNNDPEELGVSSGNDSVATDAKPEVAPGQEWAASEPTCPCSGPVNGSATLVAVATANLFDGAVTSSTGDKWAQTVDASAPYTPMTLAPGQSGTINLTITPDAPKGTVVHGFIAVDTYNQGTSSGDELINIPYTYQVG